MRKTADVIEIINEKTAKVMLYKHRKCTGCGSCNKAMHPGSIIAADNLAGAKPKDKVSVTVSKQFNPLEFIIMYILPSLMFMGGLLIGSFLIEAGGPDFLGIISAFLMLVIAILIYLKTKHLFAPKYNAKITKVIV
jgi:sigma-E factor negative regulatory protein RseC